MPKRNFDAQNDNDEIDEEGAEPRFDPGIDEEEDPEDLDEIEEEDY